MIVVSDTSPISALLTIKRVDLLKELFQEVLIPSAVAEELAVTHPDIPAFLQVRRIENRGALKSLRMELDQGEAEAIILAKESSAEFLLMDETLGRNIAGARGLPVIGLVGVFLLAKKRALIQEVRPWIEQVEQEAGFYLSEAVKAKAYAAAGELGT